METVITLVVALLVLAPFAVLALRTTRWDPVDRRRSWTLARPEDVGAPDPDDLRRANGDLAAASAHRP